MTPELQKYYEDYFGTFSSDGWEQLDEEVNKHMSDLISTAFQNNTVEDFHFTKGYVSALKYILAYPAVVQNAFDEIKKSENESV